MARLALKVRVSNCPKCKGENTFETVIAGMVNRKHREIPENNIIGYICHRCGIKLPADLKNKGRISLSLTQQNQLWTQQNNT